GRECQDGRGVRAAGSAVGDPASLCSMAEYRYDPAEIEPRWQRVWADEGTWEVSNEPDDRPKSYVLEMLPYPSGEPHIGHLKTYSVGDAIAHFHRRTGHRVLHPMGYDAFGLPAENHAIKTGEHPRESTATSIESFQRQFREWGISIDWTREFGTHEPRYYRWTQWIFLRLLERGLATRKEAGIDYPVFTTRPDTLFGATFFVLAPEHPDVFRLAEGTEYESAIHEYVNHALTESAEERGDTEREKTGVPLGRTVVNPVNG